MHLPKHPAIERVLVTGGGGFLGQAVVGLLLRAGYQVVSFSRNTYPALAALGVKQVQGDLTQPGAIDAALPGCQAIIHTAAKAGIWGHPNAFQAVNVEGTRQVLAAAARFHIKHLVYTSSPSVVFAGHDISGGRAADLPYATDYLAAYPQSKKEAEELVLAAQEQHGLSVVALRPHLIWGPNDPHFVPRLRAKAARRPLRKIGSGDNLVDVIYVDNAAHAHVLALATLGPSAPQAGKAYFLGQERPVRLWDFVGELIAAANGEAGTAASKISRRGLPLSLAYGLGGACEFIYRRLGLFEREPPVTRFLALQLARSHYFDHDEAWRDFGFRPTISIASGLARLRAVGKSP